MRITDGTTYLRVSVALLATLSTHVAGKTYYVDDDASGANDGSSWTNACNYLQDALMMASPGDDIRVAQGIYKPDQFCLGKRPNRGRMDTFQMKIGVAVRGGYAGSGEPDANARNVELYETILSGDLGSNDVDVNDPRDLSDEPTRAENSHHVVTGSVTGATAVLDGFTITGGSHHGMYNQSGSPTVANCTFSGNRADHWGGAMFNSNSSPRLNNCTFSGNSAKWGGGMFNSGSAPVLTDCTFSRNSAEHGGGMCSYGSSPTLTNCTFSGNLAKRGAGMASEDNSNPTLTNCTFSHNRSMGPKVNSYGGGMYNKSSNPTLTNCTFNGNLARRDWKGLSYGAGMYNDNSNPTLNNCKFRENGAHWGGGMFNDNSSPMLINCTFSANLVKWGAGMYNRNRSKPILIHCTFSGNRANNWGGGTCNSNSSPRLDNCTFSGNSAEYGGGIYDYESTPTLTNCTFSGNSAAYGAGMCNQDNSNPTLTNCILWGNSGGLQISGRATGSYSNIQGGWPGEGNVDADPLFADADGEDNVFGTEDDDLRLSGASPCIDAGKNSAVPPAVAVDIDGKPRIINGIVDMGAYESRALRLSLR